MLVSDIHVHIPNNYRTKHTIKAIWDTGASGCAVTTAVVNALGLIPTGKATVNTANGPAVQNTYTIDIGLPNKVLIGGIIATEVTSLASGCDALIGMDVITLGDFSITNHNGNTCMSFRIPSGHEIDYVKNPTYGITPVINPAPNVKPTSSIKNNFAGTPRNAVCPCGSTKKFKHCHGK